MTAGELTLESLNERLNQLETQVHDLQGEVKDRVMLDFTKQSI